MCSDRIALLFIVGVVAACSTATEPRPLPTILVTNTTCDLGRCATLEIRAFVWKFEVPQPPTGLEVLGQAPPGQTCLQFPASWSLMGWTWTPNDRDQVFLIAVDPSVRNVSRLDSAQVDSVKRGVPYYDGYWWATVGETPNFAPGSATGWTVVFPSAPIKHANLTVGARCSP